MKRFDSRLLAAALAGLFLASNHASAGTDTWDPLGKATSGSDGSGTWTATSTNFSNGTSDISPVNGDVIDIGTASGGYTINVSNGGSNLNYSSSTFNFNQSYTFTGDGLSIGNMQIANGVTAAFQDEIDTAGTNTKTWSLGAGSTLDLSGGGAIQNLGGGSTGTSTINITTGTYTTPGTIAINSTGAASSLLIDQTGGTITGNFNLENNNGSVTTSGTTDTYTLNGGTINGGGAFSIGGQSGGTSLATGIFNVQSGSFGTTASGVGEIRVGNDSGQGTLNVSGGVVNSTSDIILARSGGTGGLAPTDTVNISGGTTTVTQINFSRSGQTFGVGSTATVNLTGGTLYLGANGFTYDGSSSETSEAYANLTDTVNLGGGTLGVNGTSPMVTNVALTLTGINGNVKFQAANASNVAENITLNGVLSGTGGFTTTGAGTVTSTGANTYSGNTLVSMGKLSINSTGTGNVEVATGATLQLNLATTISALGSLTLDGSTADVVFGGTDTGLDTIAALTINGTSLAAGTYTESQLATTYGSQFSGNSLGGFNIIAVPEPTTLVLMFVGLGSVIFLIRRKASDLV